MIYRILTFVFFIFFVHSPCFADTGAPAGCDSWVPCNGSVNDCIKNQCTNGSVWILSPTSYCCTRSNQRCNFTPCPNQQDLNGCNIAICLSGNGLSNQKGVIGCCNSWTSTPPSPSKSPFPPPPPSQNGGKNGGSSEPIAATLCIISHALQGRIGKAMATIAFVVLGVGMFLG